MSIVEVKCPQLSESVAEATLLQWKKRPGERVEMDEILVEIETDKVVLEVPAPAAGVMMQLVKNDGETCIAEEVIAKIDTEGTESISPLDVKPVPAAEPAFGATPGVIPAPKPDAAANAAPTMPAAAKIMADHRIPAGSVPGTGKDGRVTKGDVLASMEGGGTKPVALTPPVLAKAPPAAAPKAALPSVAAPAMQALGERPEQRVPMSRLRARIAERLIQSQSTNAILTTFNEVNMAPLMEMRKRFQEKFEKEHGVKIGFMSFFVKAAVAALKKYPIINASVDGNDIVYHGYFDIGIAVGSPRGLVVPILRNADQMSFADIEKKIAEFAKKAGEGKLSLDDLTGGTFSISNLGMFGIDAFSAVINPPEGAILAVGQVRDEPVVRDGAVAAGKRLAMTLSCDHRVVDGYDAAVFVQRLKTLLETPALIFMEG